MLSLACKNTGFISLRSWVIFSTVSTLLDFEILIIPILCQNSLFSNWYLVLLMSMKKIILLFILIPCISIASSMSMIGEKGDSAEVVKVIKVKMYYNYY